MVHRGQLLAASVGLSQYLSTVELHHNNLSGDVPSNFPLGIMDMKLSDNPRLSGALPRSIMTQILGQVCA